MVKIGKHIIGVSQPPFIIAELSGNHNGSLDRALMLVDAAAHAGAHAVKLQTYTADTMTIPADRGAFVINDPTSPWNGRTLYDLYQEAHTPWDWHKAIFDRAKANDILCFSSPFDSTAVDFLETFQVPAYKIASFENQHYPLLEKVASTKKPVIMSTGLLTKEQIAESVSVLRSAGCSQLVLLKCTSVYPASPQDSNLLTIPDMAKSFNCPAGLSDHTLGIGVSLGAIALGACVIEKHFTFDRQEGGVDSAFSLEVEELQLLVEEASRVAQARGKINYSLSDAEKKSLRFKRSIYAVKDISPGESLSKENISIIRPAGGLPPKKFDSILGKRANQLIPAGTPITQDLLD
jgi:pseudaminic acid synthase